VKNLALSPPPAFDPRTVQPVASRYTDCAITARAILSVIIVIIIIIIIKVEVSPNRPGVAQRVPGGLGSKIP
jgi:hypothetical protein